MIIIFTSKFEIMKKITIFIASIFLLFSCSKDDSEHPDGQYIEEEYFKLNDRLAILYSKSGKYGVLAYEDRIGYDYETAYDSLSIMMKKYRPDICFSNTYTDTLTVDYDRDNRIFIFIDFRNENDEREIYHVLDTNGNSFDILSGER